MDIILYTYLQYSEVFVCPSQCHVVGEEETELRKRVPLACVLILDYTNMAILWTNMANSIHAICHGYNFIYVPPVFGGICLPQPMPCSWRRGNRTSVPLSHLAPPGSTDLKIYHQTVNYYGRAGVILSTYAVDRTFG